MPFNADKLYQGFSLLEALWAPATCESPVGPAALATWIDEEIGPCFADTDVQGEGAIKTFRGSWHEWHEYRWGAFDDYFHELEAALGTELCTQCIRALSSTENERIPAASASGDDGMLFAGFAYSASVDAPKAASLDDATCLRGIGPNGELILRLRRIGSFDLGENADLAHDTNRMIPVELGPREFSEWAIWRKTQERNRLGQLLRKRSLGNVQPVDYAVCLPFAILRHLERTQGTGAVRESARQLAIAAACPELSGGDTAWPTDAAGVATVAAGALIRFLFGTVSLTPRDALLAARDSAIPHIASGRDAALLSGYLKRVGAWRDALVTRTDRAGTMQAFSYDDLFIAPRISRIVNGAPAGPFDADVESDLASPLAALFAADDALPAAGARLLIEAPSGMGKTTLLRGIAAACAEARAGRTQLLGRLLETDIPTDASGWSIGVPVLIGQPSGGRQGMGYGFLDQPDLTGEDVARHIFDLMPYELTDPMRHAAGEDAADFFCSLLRRPDALVLVDSIDEVPLTYRDRYIRAVEHLATDFRLRRLVITSRQLNPASARALADATFGSTARILPFDRTQQETLYRRFALRFMRTTLGWHDAEEHLIPFEGLATEPAVRELMQNPLMITILVKTVYRSPANPMEALLDEIVFALPKAEERDYYDRYALWRIAHEECSGACGTMLPSEEFHERFARYRAEEQALQRGEDESVPAPPAAADAVDRAVTRRGLLALQGGCVVFPYALVHAYLACRWVRKTVEESEGYAQVDEQLLETAVDQALALVASAADDAPGHAERSRRAELALLFLLAHADTRSRAYRLFTDELYRCLFSGCLFAADDEEGERWRRACERIITATHSFQFGRGLARPHAAALWERRLTAFAP